MNVSPGVSLTDDLRSHRFQSGQNLEQMLLRGVTM
jgi:hypothetical protein